MDRDAPRPWLIEQPFQAVDTESFAPLADRCPRDAKPLGLAVAQSITAAVHNAGAQRQGLPGLRVAHQHPFSSADTLSGLVGRPMSTPKYAPTLPLLQRISDSLH
jgi:hypothetical protein